MANAKWASFSTQNCLPRHFQAVACVGNGSWTRNLRSYDLKPSDINVVHSPLGKCTRGEKARAFCIDTLRFMRKGFIIASQIEKNHEDGPVMPLRRRLSRIITLQKLAVCLVGPGQVYLWWACETEREHYWGTVFPSTDVIEQSLAGIASILRGKVEKVILQHDNAPPHIAKSIKPTYNSQTEVPFPLAIFSRNYGVRLWFRAMAHDQPNEQFLSYEDISKWLGSWIASKMNTLPWWYLSSAIKMESVVVSNGRYFEWFILTISTLSGIFHETARLSLCTRFLMYFRFVLLGPYFLKESKLVLH